MTKSSWLALAAALALAAPAAAQVQLNGDGATFPNIIYQDWILAYVATTAWTPCTARCSGSCSRI